MKKLTFILVIAMLGAVTPLAQDIKPDRPRTQLAKDASELPYTDAKPAAKPKKASPFAVYSKPRRVIRGGKLVLEGNPKDFAGQPDPWQDFEGNLYVPVLFDGNWSLGEMLSQGDTVRNPDAMLPPGSGLLFDGVPFYLQPGKNVWSAYHVPGPNEAHVLHLPVGLPNALEVFTVINSLGGVPNKEMLWLEFKSTCGLIYRVAMRGNRDIRDWRAGSHSNLIAPPTLNVWSHGMARLDMQSYLLPREFQGADKLESIRIIDGGSNTSQRVVLVAATVRIAAP